jgi:hypothetical protein
MFKLTEEVIKEIEEKVNKNLIDVNNGIYNEDSFFAACWIIINIEICQKYRIDIVKNENGEII